MFINRNYLQKACNTITRSVVSTYNQNMTQKVSNIMRHPYGKKSVNNKWAQAYHRYVTQLLTRTARLGSPG